MSSFALSQNQSVAYDGHDEMLVCSCNFITEKEIEDTIVGLLDEDCWQLIVPAKVYHAMEKTRPLLRLFSQCRRHHHPHHRAISRPPRLDGRRYI
ncbi:hypothetical protein ACVMB3_001682 [Sinorhizobium meliloti]